MQKLAIATAVLLSTLCISSPASASLVTFTYDDPAASIFQGTDYDNTLGFGVGDISGRVVHAYMSLTFDRDTIPTFTDANTQECSLAACGVTGSAYINNHAIPSSLPQEVRRNLANIFNNGSLAQQTVMNQVFHTGNNTISDPSRAAHAFFNSFGPPNSPSQLAIFQNLQFERFAHLSLQWDDIQTYVDGSQHNELCGATVCMGFSATVRLFNSDRYTVTVSEISVPEPYTIANICIAGLSLLGFSVARRRAERQV